MNPTWNDLHDHIEGMSAEELQQNATLQVSFDEFIMVVGWGISKSGDEADGILDHGHHYLVSVIDTEGSPVSISDEVADLIAYLRGLKDDEDDTLSVQCDRIIDALVLLSGQALTVDVAGLMVELDKVLVGDLRERTAKALISLSAKKVVTGSIEGGVLSIEEVSPGVTVSINDYDNGEDEDENGRTCCKLEFGE